MVLVDALQGTLICTKLSLHLVGDCSMVYDGCGDCFAMQHGSTWERATQAWRTCMDGLRMARMWPSRGPTAPPVRFENIYEALVHSSQSHLTAGAVASFGGPRLKIGTADTSAL